MSSSRADVLNAYLTARDGDPQVRPTELRQLEALVMEANDGLVMMVASRYRSRCHDAALFDDLVQEGRLGLLRALRCYRDDGRATLATYAMFGIRERIGRWIYEQTTPLRISATTQRAANRRGDQSLPRMVWLSTVTDVEGRHVDPASDAPGPEDLTIARDVRSILGSAVAALPTRERDLLVRYYALDGGPRVRQTALASELGVSRQRVFQLLKAASARLAARPEVAALSPDLISAAAAILEQDAISLTHRTRA